LRAIHLLPPYAEAPNVPFPGGLLFKTVIPLSDKCYGSEVIVDFFNLQHRN